MRAVITGATSGIGHSMAAACAAAGYNLILTGRRMVMLRDRGSAIKRLYNCEIEYHKVELSSKEDRARFIKRLTHYHDIELLINNAGFAVTGRMENGNISNLTAMLDVHCRATLEITHALIPTMVANRRGAIINVSSLMGHLPVPSSAIYCASKAFETSFSETLALELREYGIRVMALLPGLTKTDFHRQAGNWPFEHSLPSFFWMQPDEVARYAVRMLPKRKVICVPGFINRLLFNIRIPRSLLYAICLRIDQARSDMLKDKNYPASSRRTT